MVLISVAAIGAFMIITTIYSLEAKFALSEMALKAYCYKGYTVYSRYYRSHYYYTLKDNSGKKLDTVLIQQSETEIEFNKAVQAYIDNLNKGNYEKN